MDDAHLEPVETEEERLARKRRCVGLRALVPTVAHPSPLPWARAQVPHLL
jgi:hypothetical protein